MSEYATRITVSEMEHRRFVQEVLHAAGCAPSDTVRVADALLWSDLRGRHTNGLVRLPILTQRRVRGLIHSPAPMAWSVLATAAHRLDAAHGFGQVAGYLAMNRAMDLASANGVGLAAVRRSNHYGAAAYYCALAADAGFLGFTCTNAFPKVAPFGGKQPVLGTNPLAFGCPTASGTPILVDLSTSAISGAEVRSRSGQASDRLPANVALDTDGKPTDDPAAVSSGCLLPAAGPKGFGLGLMVEILSGLLTGAAIGREVGSLFHTWDRPINVGHLFIAVEIERFMPKAAFMERLERLLDWIAACPRQNEAEPVRFPGEIRGRYAAMYARDGIPVEERTVQALDRLADELKVGRLGEGDPDSRE